MSASVLVSQRNGTSSFLTLITYCVNPLNAELNPIYHLLALLGAHPVLHISGVRVKASSMYIAWDLFV
jgi:hypothetical protein